MLNDASGFSSVYLVCGYTDLRCGIDGLASIVQQNFKMNPYERNVLFLFCGRKTDRIKGLLFEGDGYLLLYKRLEAGKFRWPRSHEEARMISHQQYVWLMEGLSIEQKKLIAQVNPSRIV